MTDYLIMHNGIPEHYFFKPYEGICVRKRTALGVWQEYKPIFDNTKDCFAVYGDQNGTVHLITADDDNQLIYAFSSDDKWKKYVISKMSSDIYISDMKLYTVRGRLNLMYSALLNGENILVHCLLSDRAKPSTVGIMESTRFMLFNERAYYTNSDGTFGFVSLSDEKPEGFIPLYEDAHMGAIYNAAEKEIVLFMRNGRLYINGRELIYDSKMENPILVTGRDKIYIMWRSGGYLRYLCTTDGESFSEPMRFMNTGSQMSIFKVQQGNYFISCYGYQNARDIVFFGNPNVFQTELHTVLKAPSELDKLRDMLSETKRDIADTKKELERLGRVIGSLSNN